MQEERYGTRDKTYSAWHRRMSLRRFVGIEKAQLAAMIDLDASLYVEYDDGTKEPVALVEIAMDVGQDHKSGTITQRLAERAKVPAFILLYKPSPFVNPADASCKDIEAFRVKMICPYSTAWKLFTPAGWAQKLLDLRAWSAGKIDELWDDRDKGAA